jgi:CRP-like cAMP-binding protein
MGLSMDLSSFSRFTRIFRAGEIIFSEYEPGDTFYFIQSGRVKLIKDAGEVERTLDILQASEMFGEMAILENSPRSATAIALDDVKLLEFNEQNLELIILGNPQVAFKLLKVFSRRLYDAKRRVMILTLPSPHAKVADVFLMLDETQTDIDKSTDRREFKTTVEDIANWAGMTVTQTKDAMAQFVTQNRLELFPDRIVVKNINDFIRYVNARRNQL